MLFQILSAAWGLMPGPVSQASSLLKAYLSPTESWGSVKSCSNKNLVSPWGIKGMVQVFLQQEVSQEGNKPYLPSPPRSSEEASGIWDFSMSQLGWEKMVTSKCQVSDNSPKPDLGQQHQGCWVLEQTCKCKKNIPWHINLIGKKWCLLLNCVSLIPRELTYTFVGHIVFVTCLLMASFSAAMFIHFI